MAYILKPRTPTLQVVGAQAHLQALLSPLR